MEQKITAPSIAFVMEEYLKIVRSTRSSNTVLTYGKALKEFKKILVDANIDPETSPSNVLTIDLISDFVLHLQGFAPATEQLYIRSVALFYRYLVSEQLAEINLPRMDLLIEQRARKSSIRLPKFPTSEIESVLDFVSDISSLSAESEVERLRAMRDRAFLLTLADTGLRVHEACNLRRGDWIGTRAMQRSLAKAKKNCGTVYIACDTSLKRLSLAPRRTRRRLGKTIDRPAPLCPP